MIDFFFPLSLLQQVFFLVICTHFFFKCLIPNVILLLIRIFLASKIFPTWFPVATLMVSQKMLSGEWGATARERTGGPVC